MNPRTPNSWPTTVEWYEITLQTPAENLALDEVLLNEVEANPSRGILRTWQPANDFVVVGRSNQIETEVNAAQCHTDGVRIYRRSSGGGAVVVGPGCLAYALALPLTDELRSSGVAVVTRNVMETIASRLAIVIPGVTVCGTSDLVVQDQDLSGISQRWLPLGSAGLENRPTYRKFSGNSQRWLRQAFLHHGTILFDFNLAQIERLLQQPSRQPDYRSGRTHADFVTNIAVPREELLQCLVTAWNGRPVACSAETLLQARLLAQSRYERDEWNLER